MDVVIAIVMILSHFELIHEWRLAFAGAAYLIGKGIVFRGNLLSILDLLSGVYFLLIMVGVRSFLVYIVAGIMILISSLSLAINMN